MKKILAAALICTASSAFATWDLFPAQEAGKGEAKLGFQYGIPGEKTSTMGLNLGARFSIIEGLEAALMLGGDAGGYVISKSYDSNSSDEKGLDKPTIGIRYWLPMGLGIAVDAILPFGSKDLVGEEPQFGLNAGVQFSTKFTEELAFGSEAILSVIDKAGKDISNGMGLNVAVEVDYSLGAITPFLGVDLGKGLTKPDKEAAYIGMDPTAAATAIAACAATPAACPEPEAAAMGIGFSVGVIYDISESMYADAIFLMGIAGDKYKDYKPKTILVEYGLKF
jgi:hypothetical protein